MVIVMVRGDGDDVDADDDAEADDDDDDDDDGDGDDDEDVPSDCHSSRYCSFVPRPLPFFYLLATATAADPWILAAGSGLPDFDFIDFL